MPDNESVFNFDNRFQMNFNLTLCKGIYCLTNAQDDYEENMTKLNSLSSYSEKKLINTLPTLDEKFPLLSKIIIYVYMSKCSYRKLLQSDSSMKNYLQENITVTQYGNYADDIQKCLQKNAASYTSYERPLAPMYPLQNKIILFDKDIIKNCIDIIHPPKKDDHASAAYYSSQIHFTRILNKFRTLAKILFPEITEKRKSYQIPIFSLPALTFIFQTYHNKHLSTETRFSVLCDAFINIAVSKGLDLPSILNIIYLLKKGFEKSRTFSTGKDKDNKFLEFFKNPPSKSRIDDLNMQDLNVVHSRVFAEYQEMEKFYSSKISFMEDYRKIENVILSAYASWQDNFKNSSYAKKKSRLHKANK